MTFAHLFAKNVERNAAPPPHASLLGHLQIVHAAAEALTDVCGEAMLSAFGFSSEEIPRFRKIIALAAALHDVGKANDHFLGMLIRPADRAEYEFRQALRHEWISWWWVNLPGIREWVASVLPAPEDVNIVLCAIAGHHPSPHRPTPPEHVEAGSELNFLGAHGEFHEITEWLTTQFPSEHSLESSDNTQLRCARGLAGDVIGAIHRQVREMDSFIDRLGWDPAPWQKFCACTKAGLVAADVAGSALSEQVSAVEDHSIWITNSLRVRPEPNDVEQMVRERLGDNPERPFQSQVAASEHRVTLVTAGCGSGKTIAAWLWAARQCAGRRVFFCYPTTGTATEGFRGYLFDDQEVSSKLSAELFHSRSEIDFDIILNASQDEDDETDLKIASLRAWSTPVVCCTVDTVLSIMQNQRRGLYAWPAVAQGCFVFDEIHAYDDKLFGCLLQFLDKLNGLPVLLMTASLPAARLAAIREVLDDQDDKLNVIGGPGELEDIPRYHQLTAENVEQLVRNEVESGGRVLWICNVVDRAMDVADRYADLVPQIYHSRYRYEDRIQQHRAVVGAFDRDSAPKGCLAVCTQVAEMSLDISATLLVSELCPVPSLIQRLGRLNRHARPPEPGDKPPPTLPFVVVEPLNDEGNLRTMPYAIKTYGDWHEQTRSWLASIGANTVSQRDLATAWEELTCDDDPPALGDSTWIEGGPRTVVDSLRESTPSVTVVRAGADAERVERRKSDLARVAIPMPVPRHYPDWKSWRTRGGYLVAPEGTMEYSANRGAKWR